MRDYIIIGKVEPGLGKGQYYISREGYQNQFLQNLGFVPFPGTLNIKLDLPFKPKEQKAIDIEGFWDENVWPSYVPRVNARVKNDAFLLSYYFFSNGSEIDLFAQY